MKPEFNPAPCARNGGKPSLSAGFTSRSILRSLIPASALQRNAEKIQSERERFAVKVSSRDYIAGKIPGVGDKYQRIIDRGIRLDLKHLEAVRQRVAHRTVHLRDAAQGIGVLHPAAFAMRFANLAAFEHAPQIRRRLHLTTVRPSLVNALVESGVRALERVATQAAQQVGRIHQRFGREQRQRTHGQHALRAVDQRNGFFCLQRQRLDLRPLQHISCWKRARPQRRYIPLRQSTPAPDAPEAPDRRSRPRCPATARTG